MNTIIFPATWKLRNRTDLPAAGKLVGELQSALLKLKLEVRPSDLARKEMGTSTVEAVKAFQTRAGLPASGKLSQETITKLNAELAHNFVTRNKARTGRLQDMLQQLGQQLDMGEIKARKFGPSTEHALKVVQATLGVPQDGRIS